jgi:hypothetical protein
MSTKSHRPAGKASPSAPKSSGGLPHRDALEASFGTDLSALRGHVGGSAGVEASKGGMEAFTEGTDVTFAETPTLWLAAHETAHALLGHAGGDRPGEEAEADALADAVAAGRDVSDRVDVDKAVRGTSGRAAYREERGLKVGETGEAATDGQQGLWATDARISEANGKLKGVGKDGSFIRLDKGKGARSVGGKKLTAVEPAWVAKPGGDGYHGAVSDVNSGAKADSEGQTSGAMALWSDCGRSSAAVTGSRGGDREAVYRDGGETKTTKGKHDASVSGWLQTEPGGMANTIYADLVPKFIRKPENAAFLQEGVHYTNKPKTGIFAWIKSLFGKSESERSYLTPKTIVEAKAMYVGLGADGRDKFDSEAGINHHANPEIGQTYSMATEGDMPGFAEVQKDFTWNYHWAGVILKDGSDNVSLENYAVTGDYARSKGVSQGAFINREWNFDMYGTVDKSQTFHQAHLDTGTHGTEATSIAVQTGKK